MIAKRQSNIELLRIIAMVMILTIHADYGALGIPNASDFAENFMAAFARVGFESIGILGVNVFVGISGWFLIRMNAIRFGRFLFQCLWFSVGLLLFFTLLGQAVVDMETVEGSLIMKSYWFVISYIGLMVLSPVLNAFIERSDERQIRWFLIGFYLFQTVYLKDNASGFINSGYSTFSFIGIYVLARYCRLYLVDRMSMIQVLTIFLSMISANVLCGMIGVICKITPFVSLTLNYTNPIVVVGAISLLMVFSKLNIRHSGVINYFASSAFAVYLLHQNIFIKSQYYSQIANHIYAENNGALCLFGIFGFIVATYLVAVMLDQPRKYAWNGIERLFYNKKICKEAV